MYKIDHYLYEGLQIDSKELAEKLAERLVLFIVRNSDNSQARVEILEYISDDAETGDKEGWYYYSTAEASLNSNVDILY